MRELLTGSESVTDRTIFGIKIMERRPCCLMRRQRGFPEREFATRTRKAQRLMAEQGLSGLLLTTEAEVRYFSGFHTQFWQSPTRPWFVFVPAQGKPVAVIPEIGAVLMRKTWLDDIRTWNAPAPEDDGIGLLIDLFSPLASSNARIGVPKGHETSLRMPLGDWERLTAALPGLEVVDATGMVRALQHGEVRRGNRETGPCLRHSVSHLRETPRLCA